MERTKSTSVEEYIKEFPKEIQKILKEIRATIKEVAPEAEESISYGLAAYKLNGPLVYFGAYEKHIGFYALPSGHKEFAKEFSKYKTGKGSVQFPLDEPMPLKLIAKIVKFRKKENLEKVKSKKK